MIKNFYKSGRKYYVTRSSAHMIACTAHSLAPRWSRNSLDNLFTAKLVRQLNFYVPWLRCSESRWGDPSCLLEKTLNRGNKSQYWPRGAKKHVDIAENEKA